jgi:hypothetical protein
MTQGIRAACDAKFAELLPNRAEMGNTAFRKAVMDSFVTAFAITVASAATHYNHSLKMQKAADPKSVADLGRPEDKKGGRKAIHTVTVIKVKTGEVVAEGISAAKAEALITTAAAKKKAKLKIREDAPANDTVAETAPAAEAQAEAVTA